MASPLKNYDQIAIFRLSTTTAVLSRPKRRKSWSLHRRKPDILSCFLRVRRPKALERASPFPEAHFGSAATGTKRCAKPRRGRCLSGLKRGPDTEPQEVLLSDGHTCSFNYEYWYLLSTSRNEPLETCQDRKSVHLRWFIFNLER